jgi:hypothetical protein
MKQKPSSAIGGFQNARSICKLNGYLFSHPNSGNRAPTFASINGGAKHHNPSFWQTEALCRPFGANI